MFLSSYGCKIAEYDVKPNTHSLTHSPKQPNPNQLQDQIIPLVTTYHPNSWANKILQNFKKTLLLDPLESDPHQNHSFNEVTSQGQIEMWKELQTVSLH